MRVENLQQDLQDGLALINLLDALGGGLVRHQKNPTRIIHKINNLSAVLQHTKDQVRPSSFSSPSIPYSPSVPSPPPPPVACPWPSIYYIYIYNFTARR